MRVRFLTLSLLAGLALALSASRLPAPPLPAGTSTGAGALDKYLVEDTALVGVANVKVALKSPMYAKLKKEIAGVVDHEFFAKHLKLFGVRPLQDVERVVMVMGQGKVRERNFNDPSREDGERLYFLFQGKFDEKKFDDAFAQIVKDHKRAKLHGKGRTAILGVSNDLFVSLIEKTTLVVAPSRKIIEDVQARASGKSKAKFKVKELPAGLKALKSDVPIDAVGFGPMQVSGKYEQLPNGYRITPVTLEQVGFKKLTVRVTVKDELKGKVSFDGANKAGFAESAKKFTDGLEETKKRGDRPRSDPVEQALLKVIKGVTAKTANQVLTFEGELKADDAKAFLDAVKQELDRDAQRQGR
jgi:hypothetical protein